MTNVTKFYPQNAGKNPDNVLELAVGQYEGVALVGLDKEGGLDLRASTNLTYAEVVLLHVKALHYLADLEGFKEDV